MLFHIDKWPFLCYILVFLNAKKPMINSFPGAVMPNQAQPQRQVVIYNFHYSDGKLFPKPLWAGEVWELQQLDLTGTSVTENGKTRVIADGPDQTGMIMFEDEGIAWLYCNSFEGQETEVGHRHVYEQDRAAREASGHIIPVT